MKLLIIDDHPIVRKGIKAILTLERESYEIYEASSMQDTLGLLRKEDIDVVLADIKLGFENGLDIINKAKEISKNSKYLILSSFISGADFLKAETMGVDGYIVKDAAAEDIIYAINSVRRGKKYYDSSIVSYNLGGKDNLLLSKLTQREKEVLLEVCMGLSNSDIAQKLYLSESTVKKHVSSILSKLNFSHRSQVVCQLNRSGHI